jgi:hypothetical protein
MYRLLSVIVVAALFLGCGQKAEETAASEPATEDSNPLADYAGEWTLQALSMDGDLLVEVGMIASDSPDGWGMTFGHLSEPVPGSQVTVQGDSVSVAFGPYSSALQDEVMVTTTSVIKVTGDQLNGRFTAVYTNGEPPILHGRLTGSRATE